MVIKTLLQGIEMSLVFAYHTHGRGFDPSLGRMVERIGTLIKNISL
jgi:hypothetical protein